MLDNRGSKDKESPGELGKETKTKLFFQVSNQAVKDKDKAKIKKQRPNFFFQPGGEHPERGKSVEPGQPGIWQIPLLSLNNDVVIVRRLQIINDFYFRLNSRRRRR